MKSLLAYIIYLPIFIGVILMLGLVVGTVLVFDLANWATRRVEG